MTQGEETSSWQRLDHWLFCARLARTRALCSAFVARGGIRINRAPTAKPHARLRVGDVLTLPSPTAIPAVRVWRVRALGERRGPAAEAALLYEIIAEDR